MPAQVEYGNTQRARLGTNGGTIRPVIATGPAGPNTVPTDAAIAAAIETPASDTATALSAAYAGLDKLMLDARTAGVTADGATDDTTALTARVATAASPFSKSSIVLLPPGTTVVSGIDLPTGVMLKGHAYGSRLKLKNGSNRPVIRTAASDTQALRIENLTIDGNKANQSGGVSHGIHLDNQATAINPAFETYLSDCYHTVTDVLVINCDGDGVRTTGRGDTILTRVRSLLNTGDGIRVDSFDTILDQCIAGVNTGHGINVTQPNVVLTNCKGFINANGFRLNAKGLVATGLIAQGNVGDGVLLSGCTDSLIEVSAFDSNYNQSATPLTGVGVRFTNGSNRNRVRVMAFNHESPARQQAAYYIPSGSQNVIEVTTDGSMPLRPNSSNDRGNVVRTKATEAFAVDTYATSLAVDLANGSTRQITLTGSISLGRPTMHSQTAAEYFPEGQTLTFVFTQDGTGSRTVTWGAGFIDKNWQPNPTPGSTSSCTWRLAGGNWYLVSGHYPIAGYVNTYSTADKTLGAYTADVENVAYTGAADSEAKLADLNALRVAYENLRAFTEDLAQQHNALIADLKRLGLIA